MKWTQSYFALTHQKSLVIDGSIGIIMTYNFTPQYYSTSRDFGIIDRDGHDIGAMENTFDHDWQGSNVPADEGDDLVWSPGSESALMNIINGAKKTLEIDNEEMAHSRITKALIDAAERGVIVRVTMTYSSQWKKAFQQLTTAGAFVKTYDPNAPIYIHAKVIVADGSQAFVGSENFSENSLNDNRELGIIIKDPNIIARFAQDIYKRLEWGMLFSL